MANVNPSENVDYELMFSKVKAKIVCFLRKTAVLKKFKKCYEILARRLALRMKSGVYHGNALIKVEVYLAHFNKKQFVLGNLINRVSYWIMLYKRLLMHFALRTRQRSR